MDDKNKKIIDGYLTQGLDASFIRNQFINDLSFTGPISEIDEYLSSKKKEVVEEPSLEEPKEVVEDLSMSTLEEERSESTGNQTDEYTPLDYLGELTPGQIALQAISPIGLVSGYASKVKDKVKRAEYGGLEEYREYFKDTSFSGGFTKSDADKIAENAESVIKQLSPEMVESVDNDEEFLGGIEEINKKYTVGNTIRVPKEVTRKDFEGGQYTDTIFVDTTVTQEMRNAAIDEYRRGALDKEYYKTIDATVKEQILDMVPEEYKEDKEFLQYLTDKVYTEKGIDLDLDGDGRIKRQNPLTYIAKNLQFGTEDLVTGFVDALDYTFTGGDKELAEKREAQMSERNETMMEFRKGISSSIGNGDYSNALIQMGGALANTAPIIATTVATGGIGGAVIVGASGGGNAYTEAMNDPEYGDSIGGRVGYAIASGVGDFAFAAVGNSLFKTASAASQAATASARRSAILSGERFTKDALAAYARRNGLAFASEAFEEAATNVMTTYVEAIGKGQEVNLSELLETTLDAALVGGFAGPAFSGAGSIRGNSKAMIYARANATSTRAVQAEMDAEALRKEAQLTEDASKKRKLLMMADGLTRDAERAREARSGFYDMLQARHPEAAKRLMELDVEIETIARQLGQGDLSESAEKSLNNSMKSKVKDRVDLERSFDSESLNLSEEERGLLFDNTQSAHVDSLQKEIDILQMSLDEHIDREGTEAYDPDARAIAEENLNNAKKKKESFEGLVSEYKKISGDLDAAAVASEGLDVEALGEAQARFEEIHQALSEAIGVNPSLLGGIGTVSAFLDVQDQITMRYSGQWLVDSVKSLENSSLSKEGLESILDSDNWAMLTGENPSGVAVGEGSNASFNARAEEYLKRKGLKYHKIVGRYGAGENSFLVEGMTREQSAEFAALMGQESVAHKDGLVQADGSINLFDPGATYGSDVDTNSDFMSVIKDKDGNVISFSFMPSSKFQDADGNEISSDEYSDRTRANEVNEAEIKERIDQELKEGKAVVEPDVTPEPDTENPSGAIETPTAKDGSPAWRAGENGVKNSEQAKVLNKVSRIAKTLGLKVLVYPNESDAAGVSNSGSTEWGGLWKNGAIHINPERIALNQLLEKKAGFKRTKSFGETVAEEVLHAVVGPTIQRMYDSNPKRLKKITNNIVSVIKKNDPDLYERIDAKALTYSEVQDGRVQNEVEVLEEIIIEFLSAVAANPKSVTIGTTGKFQILFNTLLGSLGKDSDGIRLKDVASVYRAAASFSNANAEGFEIEATRLSKAETERQSKALVSPAALKPNADGKVKVSMNIPIYRWVRGLKKDIGSETITKEFNDQWHFINWWKKTTKNGEDSYHSGFKTEDGNVIDVDRIKNFKSKERASKALSLNTIEGVSQDVRDMADAAADQNIVGRAVSNRMKYKLRRMNARAENILKRSGVDDPAYKKELKNAQSYRSFIKAQIERAAKARGMEFEYEGGDFERASNVLQYRGNMKHLGSRTLDVAQALEKVTGLSFTTTLPNGDVIVSRSPSVMRMVHAKVIQDYVTGEALSPSQALAVMMGEVVNDPDYINKFFADGDSSKNPSKFYESYTEQSRTRIEAMVNRGRIPGTVQDNLNRFNIIVALVSPQNEADTNIDSALEILEASYKVKGKSPSLMVGSELVNFIRDGKATGIKVDRTKLPYTRGSIASLLEKFDALIRGGQEFQDLRGVPESVKKSLLQEVKQNGPFIDGAGNVEWSRVMEFLMNPYEGKSVNTRDQVFAQQIFSVKVGAWLLNLSSGMYPDMKNSKGDGMLDIVTVDTHALNVNSIYTGEFENIEAKISESSASLKRALNRHYGSDKYIVTKRFALYGELNDLLNDAQSVLDEINDKIEDNLTGKAKGSDVMSKLEVEAARSKMQSISRAVEKARNHPSSSSASSLSAARRNIKNAAKDLGVSPAVLQQFMFADSRIMKNSLGKMEVDKDGSLAYFDAYTTDHYKTYGNVLLSKNEGITPTAKDEERASQLLLFPEKSNQPDIESELYRRREPQEVLGLRDGRLMTNKLVNDALNTDATSRRIISKESVISDGQKVGIRLNLNVMKNTGVPVQTMHDKTATGEALRYAPAVMVKDANLNVNQNARRKIVTFQENKFPMASVDGGFLSDNLEEMDFNGVKAFFNPFKHNVFVDASGRPIKSASEATIVGNTVFLRGDIEYYEFNDPVLDRGREETEEERDKRIKRGPKYDKAVNRFKAFSERNGVEFVDRAELEQAYDNMTIESKVALDQSEVAANMEAAQERASSLLKIRQTAGKQARKYGSKTRRAILENPSNYFTPQSIKEKKQELGELSDSDLIDMMSNEGLARLQDRNDDLGVLAAGELIARAVSRGDMDAIPDIIAEAAAMGTTAGRILRHFRELKGSTPQGIEQIIRTAVEKRGNKLTEDQEVRLQDMAGNLFRLQAEHEALVKRAISGEDVDAELASKAKEVKAAERILDTFVNGVVERGWGELGTMLIQGNLLTPMSQITNVGANMVNALGKVAVDAIALPIERLINAFGIESPMKRNYSINAYMYGIRKFGTGFVEALDSIVTGQESDVSEWRVHRGFAPFRSLMSATGRGDLPMGADGKASLMQRIKLTVQGTLGVPAEVMFRFLSLGDVPFRRYVEGIELYQAAKNQGLEGESLKQFIKHPTKKDLEAAAREGRKLTYQEQTGASKAAEDTAAFFERMIAKGFEWIPGVDPKAMAKFLVRSNMPYIRTPANILIDTLTYVSPYVAGPRIMNNLKNGEARDAAQNFGKLVVGSMVAQTAVLMVKEGIISGAIEWDEDEEKNLAYDQFPPNSINISAMRRMLKGESTEKQKDDYFASYTKLGVMGAIMGAIVKGVDKEEVRKRDYSGMQFPIHALQDSFGVGAFSSIAYMMDQSFMQGMNTLVDVISSADATDFEKNFENWFRTTFQAVSATAFPNTLSAIYRSDREYLPDTRVTKDMPLSERIATRMAYTIKDRTFGLGDVPVRVNWKGEPIKQTPRGNNGIAYQLFDITKSRQGEADSVSNEIWRLYEQTEDLTKAVGTPTYAAKRKLNVPNVRKKHLKTIKRMNKEYTWVHDNEFMDERLYLNTDQMNRLMAASGKERYAEMEAFMATERYAKLDDEAKVEALNDIAGNYNSAIEMNGNRFREHTVVLFDILQEIYDSER